jgi:hypothetical protein
VLTIAASSLVLAVGAGASDSVVDRDDANGGLVQCCIYGEEGPSTFVALPTWRSASALNDGFEYGSAGLIQLGHGPGGPSGAPLGD